jgi:hypothetical protein
MSVEEGCYSDYGVVGFFVVLKDFDPMVEKDAWGVEFPDQNASYAFKSGEFLARLLSRGYLLEIPYGKLHLGDYSKINEVRFEPMLTGNSTGAE